MWKEKQIYGAGATRRHATNMYKQTLSREATKSEQSAHVMHKRSSIANRQSTDADLHVSNEERRRVL